VPHTPDFLWSFVNSASFMRLSLMKGAHVDVSRTASRKLGYLARLSRDVGYALKVTASKALLRGDDFTSTRGQGKEERGAMVGLTLNPDPARLTGDQLFADMKPDAQTLPA
jgi:hypothetical protein